MFILISVTRSELDINTSYHKTKKAAIDAMVKDIISITNYKSLDEIINDANAGLCGFSDDEAWAETKDYDTAQWHIEKIPTTL